MCRSGRKGCVYSGIFGENATFWDGRPVPYGENRSLCVRKTPLCNGRYRYTGEFSAGGEKGASIHTKRSPRWSHSSQHHSPSPFSMQRSLSRQFLQISGRGETSIKSIKPSSCCLIGITLMIMHLFECKINRMDAAYVNFVRNHKKGITELCIIIEGSEIFGRMRI